MWEYEDIQNANRSQLSQLSYLLSTAAAWPNLLCEVAAYLQDRDRPTLACFFQLPYALNLESAPYLVQSDEAGLYVDLRFKQALLTYDDRCSPSISELEDPSASSVRRSGYVITQAIAFIPAWSRRGDYYSRYLSSLTQNPSGDQIVVPQQASWIEHRPLSTRDFEYNVSKRLVREILVVLRSFLPAYSVLSLVEAPIPRELYGYFVMVAPGRVTYHLPPVSVMRGMVSQGGASPDHMVSVAQLQTAIKNRFREFSHFERQLFAMNELSLRGETGFALMGTIALIEWFLKCHIASTQKKRFTFRDLVEQAALGTLPQNIQRDILESYDIRNRVVHGPSRRREDLTAMVPPGLGEGRELTVLNQIITKDAVERLIRAAFELFRTVNMAERAP